MDLRTREYFVERRRRAGLPTVHVTDHRFIAARDGGPERPFDGGDASDRADCEFLLREVLRPRDYAAGARRLLLLRIDGGSSTLIDAWTEAADAVDACPPDGQTFERVRWSLEQRGYADVQLDTSRDIDPV